MVSMNLKQRLEVEPQPGRIPTFLGVQGQSGSVPNQGRLISVSRLALAFCSQLTHNCLRLMFQDAATALEVGTKPGATDLIGSEVLGTSNHSQAAERRSQALAGDAVRTCRRN